MVLKRGNMLTANIVFILLNLVFLSILIFFIVSKTGDPSILEEKYAKEIALMIDAARPGILFSIDMKEALDVAKEQEWPRENIISFKENSVRVQLKKSSGYEYFFFNDVVPIVDFLPNGRVEIKIKEK